MNIFQKKLTLLGGLEPPAFRLTAERASRLRHKSTSIVVQCTLSVLSPVF